MTNLNLKLKKIRRSDLHSKIKIIIILFLCFVFTFLFYQYFAIRKSVTYINDFKKESKMISNFYPKGRAQPSEINLKTGEKYQRIISEPVYFDVFLPKLFGKQIFNKVKISLIYQNKNQNIIELGLQKDYRNEDIWSYDIKSLENKFIDQFEGEKIFDEKKGLLLLQKTNDFKTVDQFVNKLPKNKKIATYNYNLYYPYKLQNYQPSTKVYEFNYPLSGSHTFLFYKGKEKAQFELEIEKTSDNELFNLQISNSSGEILVSKIWSDGKEISPRQKKFEINMTNNEDLYYLKINAGENFITKKIKTSQKYFIVQNMIKLATINKKLLIFADAPEISFLPKNQNGFQKIIINNDAVPVYNLLERSIWPKNNLEKTKNQLHKIEAPKGEIIINIDGFFAFSEENYFNPFKNFFPIKYYHQYDDFDYLIAKNYISPYRSKRFYQSSTDFDLTNLAGKTDYINFIVSLPGLYKNKGEVVVYKIKAELTRKPFTFSKIIKLFKK